jgi:hypothetical protein
VALSRVFGSVTYNNVFWTGWLNLLTPSTITRNHNLLQELTLNLQPNPSSLTAEYPIHSRSRSRSPTDSNWTLGNTVVFHKLAALRRSVVPHERTNATTEAIVDALYSCRLIVATFLFVVTLHFSRITMPTETYYWKGRIVTKSTYEKITVQQKTHYSFCYVTL